MRNIVFIFTCFNVYYCCLSNNVKESDLTIIEIIESHGYPTETHEIETEDGYLLDVYRVHHGRKTSNKQSNKYPVLLAHGLLGTSENFIYGGPEKALTYLLADNGFDVWLFNARGSWHSRKHKHLDPDRDKQYWQFTWHEIGVYDTTSVIDYVLNITNQEKLHYIGHSQGTTAFFAMAATKPEYNEKIKLMVALAPSVILHNMKLQILKILASLYKFLERLAEALKIYELIPRHLISNKVVRAIGKALCGEGTNRVDFCTNILLLLDSEYDAEELDPETIPLIVATIPAGSSVYQPFHYAQVIVTETFTNYDWGPKENMRRYNSSTPPRYDLKKVTAPVLLAYSEGDSIATKEDVATLAKTLPNVVEFYRVPHAKWSHFDFMWAKDVHILLNRPVIKMMKKYNS